MSTRPRDSDRDPGMTLVEVVVNTAVIALIITSLSATAITLLRLNPMIERATDAAQRQTQFTSLFLEDVRSTPPSGVDLAAGAPGCGSTSGSTNILQLTWSTATGVARTSYRVRTDRGRQVLERRECVGASVNRLRSTRTVRFPAPLASANAVKVTMSSNTLTLEMQQTTRTLRLSGQLRSTLGSLP